MSGNVLESQREAALPYHVELDARTATEIEFSPEVRVIVAGGLFRHVVLMCRQQETILFSLASFYFDAMNLCGGVVLNVIAESLTGYPVQYTTASPPAGC